MPIIINAENVRAARQGAGWVEYTLANTDIIGAPAMVASRWVFEPGARGPELIHGDTSQLLYVIRGSGSACVEGEALPLAVESVLWLEPGEQVQFIAGDNGLEILQGYAPGE